IETTYHLQTQETHLACGVVNEVECLVVRHCDGVGNRVPDIADVIGKDRLTRSEIEVVRLCLGVRRNCVEGDSSSNECARTCSEDFLHGGGRGIERHNTELSDKFPSKKTHWKRQGDTTSPGAVIRSYI